MAQWWTYGLGDFLMFSPDAYWRLVGRANAAWWPAHLLGVAASLALPWLARQGHARPALVMLALAWGWVGWGFHWRHYAEIFLAAPWLAAACGAQALLLLAAAALPTRPFDVRRGRATMAGLALLALALLWPLLAPLTGHPLAEAEVFGFLPDPTALATLGVLLALQGVRWPVRALLAVLPALSLLLGAATRWLLA